MIVGRNLLAAITVIAAFIALAGAAALQPTVMGVSGIVAAITAIGWGLLTALLGADCELSSLSYRSEVSRDGGGTWIDGGPDELELPYRPVESRPFWDTNIMGAPE